MQWFRNCGCVMRFLSFSQVTNVFQRKHRNERSETWLNLTYNIKNYTKTHTWNEEGKFRKFDLILRHEQS